MTDPSRPNPSPRLRRRRHTALTALLLSALLILGLAIGIGKQPQPNLQSPGSQLVPRGNEFRAVRNFAIAAQGGGISKSLPQVVKIGIEINNIYNLSVHEQTFMANGSYWLQWPESVQRWMDQEGIEADKLIQFTNNIVSYDFLVEPTFSKPKRLADGTREQTFKFSGHFWIENLDFRQFPFQALEIPILFEIKPEIFALTGDKPVALVADPHQPDLLGSLIEIPGLVLRGGALEPFIHRYGDDTSIASGTKPLSLSQVRASAVFTTHPVTSIGAWLLPIAIVMLTVFIAPSISGRLSDMRIAIPSAALLTLVVMQQSFETAIPQLSYLTFLDLVYLWCYAITAGLFILFVWSSNRLAEAEFASGCDETRLAAITARIDRVDRRFQAVSLIGTAILMGVALLR